MNLRHFVVYASTLVAAVAACDRSAYKSIEVNNEGVKAFNENKVEKAIKHFRRATEIHEGNHSAWYHLGQVYLRTRQFEKAVDAFKQAVRHQNDDAMYLLYLGVSEYEKERNRSEREGGRPNLSEAQASLERAVELNGNLFRAHYYLGRTYRDLGKPREAAEALTRACELNPRYGWPFVALGKLYLEWDRPDDAIQVLEQGAKYAVDPEERTNMFFYLGRAWDAKALGGAESARPKAVSSYTDALRESPQNQDALFQRGLAHMRLGDRDSAARDLDLYLKTSGSGSDDSFNRQEAQRALYQVMEGQVVANEPTQ